MVPSIWNTALRQGSLWHKRLTLPASFDLTGYTARMDIVYRNNDSIRLELDTSAGGITLDANARTIDIAISAADTATLREGVHGYDLELVADPDPRSPTAEAQAIVAGTITVVRQWTLP